MPQLLKGDSHKPLVRVQEGGECPSIDVLGQTVYESGSSKALSRPFTPLNHALVHERVQVLLQGVVRGVPLGEDLLEVSGFPVPQYSQYPPVQLVHIKHQMAKKE
jgi:hypothetical protein